MKANEIYFSESDAVRDIQKKLDFLLAELTALPVRAKKDDTNHDDEEKTSYLTGQANVIKLKYEQGINTLKNKIYHHYDDPEVMNASLLIPQYESMFKQIWKKRMIRYWILTNWVVHILIYFSILLLLTGVMALLGDK